MLKKRCEEQTFNVKSKHAAALTTRELLHHSIKVHTVPLLCGLLLLVHISKLFTLHKVLGALNR